MTVEARAPGRVNLIGDHTDYTGGYVLPMAIDRWTTVAGERFGDVVALRSEQEPHAVELPLVVGDPASVEPAWGRYVAGVVAELRPTVGFSGRVTSTVPLGAGLSSSAALEVAVALALGATGPPPSRWRRSASGPSSGRAACPAASWTSSPRPPGCAGCALLIDCTTLDLRPVELPAPRTPRWSSSTPAQPRALAGSAYAERAAQCANAEPDRRAAAGGDRW